MEESKSDPWIRDQITQVQEGKVDPNYTVKNGILYFQGKFCIGPLSNLQPWLLEELHGSNIGGHSGFYRTLRHVQQCFFWKGMNKFIHEFVACCSICQQIKSSTLKPMGLLQSLPIPLAVCEDLSMDFVTDLPTTKGHFVIVIVVDRLTKYCHLGSLPASYSASSVADFFIKHNIQLHGVPKTLVSNHDKVFIRNFWKEILV